MRLLSFFAILAVSLLHTSVAMAAAQAFPPTASGSNELKTLPAGLLLRSAIPPEAAAGEKAARESNYFSQSGRLFRPLFRYIDARDIAMTTPVEARVEPGEMYFWVAASERAKVDGADVELGVTVVEVPQRLVASRGERGGYSRDNYEAAEAELRAWVAGRADLVVDGEAYPVFWDGPFTPWFAKQFEVHLPVRMREAKEKDQPGAKAGE